MSSRWTNKYAIMQDLSLAQGCGVPADLGATVAAGEKPPVLNIMEETEEEYYQNGVDDDCGNASPDINLIQHMLKVVQNVSSESEEDIMTPDMIQITKPVSNTVVDNKKVAKFAEDCSNMQPPENSNIKKQIVKKVKKKRENVAVNSILQGLLGIESLPKTEKKPKTEPIKLLKPTDFMLNSKIMEDSIENVTSVQSPQKEEYFTQTTKIIETHDEVNSSSQTDEYSAIVESVQKVKGWLDSNKNLDQNKNILNWEPTSMFRKKSGSAAKSLQSDSVKSSPPQTINAAAIATTTTSYQPSTLADEYYQKYMERSKVKEFVKEDVWTRAERVMKDIDAKKKMQAEDAALIEHQLIVDCVTSYEEIRLPQHRHLLTGDCVVCEITKKNGIEIDVALLHNTEFDENILSAYKKHVHNSPGIYARGTIGHKRDYTLLNTTDV